MKNEQTYRGYGRSLEAGQCFLFTLKGILTLTDSNALTILKKDEKQICAKIWFK